MKDFKKLIVWQSSIELVKDIYLVSGSLPSKETFILAI